VAIGPRGMEPPLEDLAGKRTRNGSIYDGLSSSQGSPQLTATQPPVIRILVVEDDVLQREAMSMMLVSISESHVKFGLPPLRLDVVSVGSGEEGYEALRKKDHRKLEYHFCIVDITLPGITGLDMSWCYTQSVTNEAGAVDDTREEATPAVLIACTHTELGPDTLESYGIRDCLRKPVCVSSLRHMLHKWLPRMNVADVTSTFSTLGISSTPKTAGFARGGSGSFRARVLLVDDCNVTLTATCYLFQELGLWVDTAPSGEAAMDLIKSTRDFDLLLLDVHLPCMSGYALCSWYKSFCHDAGRVPARVVAVTSDPDIETCASFGVDRCLPKPLTVNCAELVLAEWLSHRALELEVNQLEHREDSLDTAHYVKRPTPSHDNLPVPYVDATPHIRPTRTTSSALG